MKKEDKLFKNIQEHLDKSVDDLDPNIAGKIRQARYKALEQQKSGWLTWGIPLSGIAATAVVVIIAVSIFRPDVPRLETRQVEMVEMLMTDQNLEIFENMEFYIWLAANPKVHIGS